MTEYVCDGCGRRMDKRALRYTVSIEVRAAYDQIEIGLVDLVRSHRQELLDLIESMKESTPQEIEEQVYKRLDLDLCPRCQKAFIRGPLKFGAGGSIPESEVDIDAFLRSLGFGPTKEQA